MSETVAGAVEQVAAPKMITPDTFAREFEYHRDVPASCICTWAWGRPGFRWSRIGPKPGCPWHRGSK